MGSETGGVPCVGFDNRDNRKGTGMTEYWWVIGIGIVLLALAIAYAMRSNKTHSSPGEIARTERATHDLQEKIDREDQD